MINILFVLIITWLPQKDPREIEVRAVLDAQVEAWNRGDISGYMAGYWRSEKTVFLSDGSKTLGFDEVAGRYAARYRTREDMGILAFEDLEVRFVGATTAIAHGIWRLRRMSDEPWGRFTLVIEKKKEGWRITHDHTSSGK
jgi:ketosteroid isomerase-like protein